MVDGVYLDYNATTPVAPEVLEEMLPWMTEQFWNASSSHVAGRSANSAVERARAQFADVISASPREVVWTSGSTEANNLAIKGSVHNATPGAKILVAGTEHKAVLDTAYSLTDNGVVVQEIAVDPTGRVDLEDLAARLDEDVALVSVMLANNETGVIQPLREIADMAHRCNALVHTDATQAVGKLHVDVVELDVDLASFSAHKFYGPKGIGALYVRRGVRLFPLLHGGGHESGRRSGTLNVPGIVGLGAAAELSRRNLDRNSSRGRNLVSQLIRGLEDKVDGVELVTGKAERLPNTANLRFVGVDAEAVMANAPRVLVSSGSACTSSVPDASHVLQRMGLSQEAAFECLRFSVGWTTTETDIDIAVDEVAKAVGRIRQLMHGTQPTHATQGVAR